MSTTLYSLKLKWFSVAMRFDVGFVRRVKLIGQHHDNIITQRAIKNH